MELYRAVCGTDQGGIEGAIEAIGDLNRAESSRSRKHAVRHAIDILRGETAEAVMRIVVGSDHRGFQVKQKVIDLARRLGSRGVRRRHQRRRQRRLPRRRRARGASKVSSGEVDRGILICGTGIGMGIAANKFPGVRAAPCHDDLTAEMSRRHNDLNVLCLSADMLGEKLIDRMVEIWLNTRFEGGRHARRVEKIADLEKPA